MNIYFSVYDNVNRLMIELMILFGFILKNGKIIIDRINYDYIWNHQDKVDNFLLSAEYYTVDEHYRPEPHDYFWTPEDEDIFINYIPDLIMFKEDVEYIINNPSSESTEKALTIINILYKDLYDRETLNMIRFIKSRYLVSILSRVLIISGHEDGVPSHIRINNKDIAGLKDRFSGMTKVLTSLGFSPFITVPIQQDTFIKYVENYINSGVYNEDGFTFGEAFLRAYDSHVEPIGWI